MVVNIRCFLGPHPPTPRSQASIQECTWGTEAVGPAGGAVPGACPRVEDCVWTCTWGERLGGVQDAAKTQSHCSLVGTPESSGPGQAGVLVPGRW